jgi:hypothetical protein
MLLRVFDILRILHLLSISKIQAKNEGHQNYFLEKRNLQDSPRMYVVLRSPIYHHLTCIHHVRPSYGDVFYLRTILLETAASSFTDARTVHGNPPIRTLQKKPACSQITQRAHKHCRKLFRPSTPQDSCDGFS